MDPHAYHSDRIATAYVCGKEIVSISLLILHELPFSAVPLLNDMVNSSPQLSEVCCTVSTGNIS